MPVAVDPMGGFVGEFHRGWVEGQNGIGHGVWREGRAAALAFVGIASEARALCGGVLNVANLSGVFSFERLIRLGEGPHFGNVVGLRWEGGTTA